MRLSPLSGKSLGRCIMGFTTISPRSLVYDFSTWGAPFHHLFPCQKWAIATFPILGNSKICGTTTSSGKLPLKKHLLSLDTLNTLSTSSRADPYIVHISPPKLTVIFIHLLDELTVNFCSKHHKLLMLGVENFYPLIDLNTPQSPRVKACF